MFDLHTPRPRKAADLGALLCVLALCALAPGALAQQSEPAPTDARAGADPTEAAVSPADAGGQADARRAPTEAQLEAAAAAGLTPVASYVVADEITVRATRPGEIRKQLWDLDTEIESTVMSFYRLLNEVIVDPQFHVHCVRDQPEPFSRGTRIIQRRCYSGFQIDELEAMRPFAGDIPDESGEPAAFAVAGDVGANAGAGVHGPNDRWLSSKEQQYAEVVMEAINSVPALMVAAENLAAMQVERERLTGGEAALSVAQYERDLARRNQQAQFELLERRRERKAERETEREAERAARRVAQDTGRP